MNLNAEGNGTITWQPTTFLNNPSISNPISTPDSLITYTATLTSPEGCVKKDSVTISVFQNPPVPILADTLAMCAGSQLDILISGGITYEWSPNSYILSTQGNQVTVFPPDGQWYYCLVTNACGSKLDSVFVKVTSANIVAGNDTTICPNEKATLWAYGATNYIWYPNDYVESAFDNLAIVKPAESTVFYVIGIDSIGCRDTAQVEVVVHPYPSLQVSADVFAFYDDEIQLNAITHVPGILTWTPPEFLSCVNCPNPIATPNTDITYFVEFIDPNGCKAKDFVNITYRPAIYVPNTFIPDGNNTNEVFKVYGGNIKEMECLIFNRWGELVYTLKSTNDFWDGTFKGKICQDGTYTWKLKFQDFQLRTYQLTGHVNLLR